MVAFGDDDGILLHQVTKVRKGRPEHRVGRDVRKTAVFVELQQVGFHRCDVGDDTIGSEMRQYASECVERVGQGDAVDDHLGGKRVDLVDRLHTQGIVDKTHPLRVLFEYGHLMVETQQVGKERPHLSRA